MSYVSCFGVTLQQGGALALVIGPVVAGLVQWIVTLGLSELASAFPSSGVSLLLQFMLSVPGIAGITDQGILPKRVSITSHSSWPPKRRDDLPPSQWA